MNFHYEYEYGYKYVWNGFSGYDAVPDPSTLRIVIVPGL